MKIYIGDCEDWRIEDEVSNIGDRRWSGTFWDNFFFHA